MTRVVPKKTFVEILRGSRLLLGQRRDKLDLSFEEGTSFSGRIADLTFWREELVSEEIQDLAK